MNSVNYLPRSLGGRGLRSLEDSYKMTKIKVAIKLVEDEDQRMEIVRQFHEISEGTSSFSIFKDAKRFCDEIDVDFVQEETLVAIVDKGSENEVAKDSESFAKHFKRKMCDQRRSEIIASTWQGVNLAQRINDEGIVKTYFDWMTKWRTCPTDVVNEFFLLFYQLLHTKQYMLTRSNEVITDTKCRMCRTSDQESVKHLISNCNEFASSLYMTRHNNALKCFVWPMLHMYGLVEKCPTWYAPDEVKPHYSNETVEFWWDVPEYTGRDTESIHPPRPDGKLKINTNDERRIFLIEMTVPWTGNRREKFEYKHNKYMNIQHSIQFENPGYEVDQITLVMDVFGGYGMDLTDNIKKVIKTKKLINSVLRNMQKSIISSCATLSRTFKIRSKKQ